MPGKYTPLENYLRNLSASQKEVILRFAQIEKIINSKLPTSANELSWWEHETEGNHVNKRAWANAGWKIASVDLKRKQVKLIRA